MPIVFACIAPHGGNLLLPETAPGPVPAGRKAMATLRESLRAARPDSVAILTPHGIAMERTITLGVTETGYGELDELKVAVQTDLDLAAAWAYRAAAKNISVTPLSARKADDALPLDWGVTIPLALLTPPRYAADGSGLPGTRSAACRFSRLGRSAGRSIRRTGPPGGSDCQRRSGARPRRRRALRLYIGIGGV